MKKLLALLLTITFASGCATTRVADMTAYNTNSYPPKGETYEMKILDRGTVDREYSVIGEVREKLATVYDSEEEIIASLKLAAKRMGGDAIIDFETKTVDESHDWIPDNNTYYKAKVIVYSE